jgi:hypothetical protein
VDQSIANVTEVFKVETSKATVGILEKKRDPPNEPVIVTNAIG